MKFFFFICAFSLLHVAKVDVVYILGDKPPTGKYRNLLIDTGQNILVLRKKQREVTNWPFTPLFRIFK